MDLLREELRKGMEQKGYSMRLPEETDARFPPFPLDKAGAVRLGSEGKLSGVVLASEVRRWEATSKQFVRVLADFKLMRLEDGAVLWERRVQSAVPTPSATDLGQAYMDAVKSCRGRVVLVTDGLSIATLRSSAVISMLFIRVARADIVVFASRPTLP